MSRSVTKIGVVTLVSMGLFVALFAGSNSSASSPQRASFARKVNLALRRTAHQLLQTAGDQTSRIPPVEQRDANTFAVTLNHTFNYGQLPTLLQESFRVHNIDVNYDVAVLDCARGDVQLGYNARDLLTPNGVACVGRQQKSGCYTLLVTLNRPESALTLPPIGWVLSIGMLVMGFVYLVRRKPIKPVEVPAAAEPDRSEPELIHFGQSSLNPATYTLQSGDKPATLTYREVKLLRFFIDHSNQILERDRILKAVWQDDGIIVDRSVDVFVSRLRKLLQDDPTIRIIAVYGVGYRLEIQ